MPEVHKAIQSIIQAVHASTPDSSPRAAPQRVICISRDLGSGGGQVAALLGKRLGLDIYDWEILDRISKRLHADAETMRAVDAGARELRDLWLYSLVTGEDLDADNYRRQLENVVLSLGRSGGIILGRGAHLILARSGALRVRFTGSPEVCARRLAAARGGDPAQWLTTIDEVNHRRSKFVWDSFRARLNDPRTFDITVNTDQFADLEKAVDLLVCMLAAVG